MNYIEAENYLLSLNNLPRKEYMNDPRRCGLYLKRLQFFLDIIGNPEKKIPHYIHVTGTSGKGSVCNFLQGILSASHKKVGLSTSPHPTYITERMQIANIPMTQLEFTKLVQDLKKSLEIYIQTSPYDMLSFFEITEALGLKYFADKKVDWAIMEVGCGGRYDSSNVIPYKDVAVITNIGLDHVGLIGNNKMEIAAEKSGIIKKGSVVFTMEKDKKIIKVIEKECKKNSTKLNIISSDSYQLLKSDITGSYFIYQGVNYKLNVIGEHQIKNAILTIEIAKNLKIKDEDIKKGLLQTKQPIRMEIVSKKPLTILDGAHNPDKIQSTVSVIEQINYSYKNLHLVLGFSDNKDISSMLKKLVNLKPKTIACTRNTSNLFRKVADPKILAKNIKKVLPQSSKVETFLDPFEAMDWSKKQAKSDDLILVTGSIFLSGELRKKFLLN